LVIFAIPPRHGPCAGDVPELALLGLPDAIVVRDAVARLEACGRDSGLQLSSNLFPRACHLFKNLRVLQVARHLLLVPPLAYHEEPVGSAIVVGEHEMLPRLPDRLLQSWVAV
jgi:hypothetical protein